MKYILLIFICFLIYISGISQEKEDTTIFSKQKPLRSEKTVKTSSKPIIVNTPMIKIEDSTSESKNNVREPKDARLEKKKTLIYKEIK
jgi:hypothetical protein